MKLSDLTTTISEKFNAVEEYFDNKIATGRFIQDISYYAQIYSHSLNEKNKQNIKKLSQSPSLKKNYSIIQNILTLLNAIPIFGPVFRILIYFLKIFLYYYADIFIIFALTFPSSVLLANLYQSSPTSFFALFIPILFVIIYCYAALFLYIHKREDGEKISLFGVFRHITKKSSSIFLIILLQITIIIQLIIGYFFVAYFYSDVFNYLNIVWSNSFIYWFIVVFLALLLFLAIFIVTIIAHQVFFITIFEEKTLYGAIQSAWYFYNKNQLLFSICYLCIFFLSVITIYNAFLYFLFIGIAITCYAWGIIAVFIGYSIHHTYYRKNTYGLKFNKSPSITLPLIIVCFGIMNYVLLSLLTIKQYDAINRFIYTQRSDHFFNAELKTYINRPYAYTISYPKTWAIYEKNPNSVKIYNNYNGTISGGIWLDINVSPYDKEAFHKYYDAPIGKLSADTDEQIITYKISNISIDGNEGVAFTVDKNSQDDPSYQTIYLIHKDDLLFRLNFTSKSKTTEGYSYGIVDKMINSFRFIK